MAARKNRSSFFCTSCGYQSPKWLGKCPACGEWGTMREAPPEENGGNATADSPELLAVISELEGETEPRPLNEISEVEQPRRPSGIGEFDRVLGGGVVPGSVVLVGGDPGIGKSTLLLQVLDALSRPGKPTLYVSGEESPGQSRLRSQRMGIDNPELYFYAASDSEKIIRAFRRLEPTALVIDSIQTCHSPEIKSPPGTTSQIRQTAAHLVKLAKLSRVPIFIIGHVTKEGAIAGPKLLEHMVDTVLYFESDTQYPYRILRAVKNRFGSTNEIGVFEMTGRGLLGVDSPSSIFLHERPQNLAGSLVSATIEGSRPILTEIQALVSGAVSGGIPRRTTLGIDRNRAALMIAILEKRLQLDFSSQDIFLNIVGGLKVVEPAIDLALIAAILSSHLDQAVPATTAVIGEVGLTGEIRRVNQLEQRLAEALKFGFERILIPQGNLGDKPGRFRNKVIEISSLRELPPALFSH